MIPWLGQPKRFAAYLAFSPCFLCIYGEAKGRCLFVQLWRVRRARLQHPGCPCVPLMAWGWCASSVPGTARTAAGGMQPSLRWTPPNPDPVVALCQEPCHPLGWDKLLRRNGAGERESSSCRGQAVEGTCCAHGSSQRFSQGTKMCLVGPCVRTAGNCSAELFPGSVPAPRT